MLAGLWPAVQRVLGRFLDDRCLTGAAALSYSTIVSLVPLTAIMLVVFSFFSRFDTARDRLLKLILENFAPNVGNDAAGWFASVAGNAAQSTAIGAAFLVVTAILLLATIDEHLHFIFRVREQRGWGRRALAYALVLTAGPILIGIGLSVTGSIDGAIAALGLGPGSGRQVARVWSETLSVAVPPAIEILGFALLYRLIPNRRVLWRACFIGAVVATLAIEILKLGFGVYIGHFASYSAIYGALAGIPIVLLWMYLFWAMVLLGAETAACLTDPAQLSVENTARPGV